MNEKCCKYLILTQISIPGPWYSVEVVSGGVLSVVIDGGSWGEVYKRMGRKKNDRNNNVVKAVHIKTLYVK